MPQVYPYEYDLILRPDINTRGHTQWFHFTMANTRAGVKTREPPKPEPLKLRTGGTRTPGTRAPETRTPEALNP